jgi:hypothetical protein
MQSRSMLILVLSVLAGAAAGAGFLAYFGRESMIIALAVGVPVGLGGRFAFSDPARRQVLIGLGAALALVGGLAGGYVFAYDTQLQKAVDRLTTESEFTDDKTAAKAFAKHDAIKGNAAFMVDYGYNTDAESADKVDPDELRYFEQHSAPTLRWLNEGERSYADWKAKEQAALTAQMKEKVSVMQMVMHKRDWINTGLNLILTLALAIGLAVGNRQRPTSEFG